MAEHDMVAEPEKEIPILCDVDVAVAGGGVSGVFAALAASRNGAKTALIDRFGSIGGNMGPGMIAGGSLSGWPIEHVFRGFAGIPKRFIERHKALGGGSVPPHSENNYLRDSNIASYVALDMLEESGVKVVLSTFVADPILEGNRVCGLFVENKSGRRAVKAKVVVDATGEADVARRAGAPVLYPKRIYFEMDGHAPTGMGLYYVLGGVDWKEYEAYEKNELVKKPKEEDLNWAKQVLDATYGYPTKHAQQVFLLMPQVRKAWESGEYRFIRKVGTCTIFVKPLSQGPEVGMAWGRSGGRAAEEENLPDLEAAMRRLVFETAQFWKRHMPGFGNSYLMLVAPFLGFRGGPCIEGEYVFTMDDVKVGRKFPDALFVFDHISGGAYKGKWRDFPYRAMLPKKVDGLIAVGRSASCMPDTLLRNRMTVMHMGQAGGVAAALAVENNVAPRELDVKDLQRNLLDAGFYLGDNARLQGLGLN